MKHTSIYREAYGQQLKERRLSSTEVRQFDNELDSIFDDTLTRLGEIAQDIMVDPEAIDDVYSIVEKHLAGASKDVKKLLKTIDIEELE